MLLKTQFNAFGPRNAGGALVRGSSSGGGVAAPQCTPSQILVNGQCVDSSLSRTSSQTTPSAPPDTSGGGSGGFVMSDKWKKAAQTFAPKMPTTKNIRSVAITEGAGVPAWVLLVGAGSLGLLWWGYRRAA